MSETFGRKMTLLGAQPYGTSVALGPAPSGSTAGTTDSTAINAALTALSAAGGGTLILQAGTYWVAFAAISGFAGYKAAVQVPANCKLMGQGQGATIVKLAASQVVGADSCAIVRNKALSGGDEHVAVENLTIDGNGNNQTTLYAGVSWVRVRGARHKNVCVKNVRGTASFPPGETFHFDVSQSTDVFYNACEAVGDAGTQGTGFSVNYCTNVAYGACVARGMSAGMGFTNYYSTHVSHVDCFAQLNVAHGFNCENSDDVSYTGCHGGGAAAPTNAPYPYTAGQSLGNTDSGFTINAATNVEIVGCHAHHNGNNGLSLINSSSGRIVGGSFTGNTNSDVYFDNSTTKALWTTDTTTGWVTPTLGTGWSNQGAPYQAVRYRMFKGVVYIEGLAVSSGALTSADVLFTLPVGFRPASVLDAPPFSAATLEISAGGLVRVSNSINGSLSCCFSFVPDQ